MTKNQEIMKNVSALLDRLSRMGCVFRLKDIFIDPTKWGNPFQIHTGDLVINIDESYYIVVQGIDNKNIEEVLTELLNQITIYEVKKTFLININGIIIKL